jgi:hypothetical protein
MSVYSELCVYLAAMFEARSRVTFNSCGLFFFLRTKHIMSRHFVYAIHVGLTAHIFGNVLKTVMSIRPCAVGSQLLVRFQFLAYFRYFEKI